MTAPSGFTNIQPHDSFRVADEFSSNLPEGRRKKDCILFPAEWLMPAEPQLANTMAKTVGTSNSSVLRPSTWLSNLLLSTKPQSLRRWHYLFKLREWVLRYRDPTIEYKFCGATLRLPLSHALPFFRRASPLYAENLGRIARQLYTRFGFFSVIDIGANIGDSVATIHQYTPLPILCVGGVPRFAELLGHNVSALRPTPAIERCFVGTGGKDLAAVVQDGTAKLAHAEPDSHAIPMKSLQEILLEHSSFQGARLLKIDTDGMDIVILASALDWIAQQKPVLFFEYDPDLQQEHGAGGLEILGRLKKAGYQRVLVYEGNGDYMLSAELEDYTLFLEMHEYFSGRLGSGKWCDLCIFHADDEEIAQVIRRSELDVFRAARRYSPARDPAAPCKGGC